MHKQEHQIGSQVVIGLERHNLWEPRIKSLVKADKFKPIAAIKIIRLPNGTRRVRITIILVLNIARKLKSWPTLSYHWRHVRARRKTSIWSSYSCSSTKFSHYKSQKKTPRISTYNRFLCKQRPVKSRKMHKNPHNRLTASCPYSPRAQYRLTRKVKGRLKSQKQI